MRAALTFAAARTAWACGQAVASRELLSTARATATDPVLLSDIARLRGHIEVNIGSATDAHQIFIDAVHAVHDADPLRALEMAVAAAVMRTYAVDSGAALQPGDLLVEPSAGDTPRTRCLKQLLVAMTLTTEQSWSGAVAALDSALASGEEVDDLAVQGNLGNAALQLGDDEAQQRFYTVALSRARDRGAVTGVVYALQRLCFGHLLAGELAAVRNRAEEALALGQSIGQRRDDRASDGLADAAGRAAGPRRLRHPSARARRGRGGVPPGHPDRPRARPHPLGQGDPRSG